TSCRRWRRQERRRFVPSSPRATSPPSRRRWRWRTGSTRGARSRTSARGSATACARRPKGAGRTGSTRRWERRSKAWKRCGRRSGASAARRCSCAGRRARFSPAKAPSASGARSPAAGSSRCRARGTRSWATIPRGSSPPCAPSSTDTASDPDTTARPPRLACIDACRGLAVVAMLAANCVNVFLRRVPATLAHNQGDVLRLFDLPAPAFQFLVGVSLVLFLRNRRAAGRSPVQARVDATRRFVPLMLLGMLLDSVGGLAATALADMPDELVAAVAIALLGPYSGAWNSEVHGSPDAALAFVPLTLAGLLVGRAALGNDPRRALVRRGT